MLSVVFLCLLLLPLATGDHLILELSITCPARIEGRPNLKLIADVPANATAHCKNGDKHFTTHNGVVFTLAGTFDQSTGNFSSECVFYTRMERERTLFFLDVMVGHGDSTSVLITSTGFKTLACSYYLNGNVVRPEGKISSWTPIHNDNSDVFGVMSTGEMEVIENGEITFGDEFGAPFDIYHDSFEPIFDEEPDPLPESELEEPGVPIIELTPACPDTDSGDPEIKLRTDVPAYASTLCKNGEKQLISTDHVHFSKVGSFDQGYSGDLCLFYKKNGSNTYTVDVEVGWGQKGSEVIDRKDITTVSCAYDEHGKGLSIHKNMASWFIAPLEQQNLLGQLSSTASFDLKVVDVLDREMTSNHIRIGRKIRLRAVDSTDTVAGFRVLSCDATNSVTSFAIIRAGCGDGRVFPKTAGFSTKGKKVYSPYFDAFRLRGGRSLQFNCTVIICEASCDGSSCSVETGR